jgi:hypothetical protein
MEQLTISYEGLDFTVWGYYTKEHRPTSYYERPEEADFDIREVYLSNDNIIELLKENIVDQLQELALEQLDNK